MFIPFEKAHWNPSEHVRLNVLLARKEQIGGLQLHYKDGQTYFVVKGTMQTNSLDEPRTRQTIHDRILE
jgi:mannose-6-phosphate isomerase-like protein (cupin superfamily)